MYFVDIILFKLTSSMFPNSSKYFKVKVESVTLSEVNVFIFTNLFTKHLNIIKKGKLKLLKYK